MRTSRCTPGVCTACMLFNKRIQIAEAPRHSPWLHISAASYGAASQVFDDVIHDVVAIYISAGISAMRALYWVVLLTALVVLASLTTLLRNAQSCACEQTYMYTSYTEIPVLDPRWSKHRYKLRLYRETAFATQSLPPTGFPALLVPGNAGSYEQVRSLASESARLAARARKVGASIPDLDWYTLDLNSELSAFDGHLLSEQAEFAVVCLAQLKAMYSIQSSTTGDGQPSSSSLDVSRLPYNLRPQLVASASSSSGGSSSGAASPTGILLVGHSMGGVVARAAAAAAMERPDIGPGSIALLLTLASPHQAPPLLLQPQLAHFYDTAASAAELVALPAVSVHGGTADMQVSPYLTRLPAQLGSSSSTAAVSVASLTVPGVWLHAGHTQIDWCNQLASRLAAALMEVHVQQQRWGRQMERHTARRSLQHGQQRQLRHSQGIQTPQRYLPSVGDVGLCVGMSHNHTLYPSSSSSRKSNVSALTHSYFQSTGLWHRRSLAQQCPRLPADWTEQRAVKGTVQVGVMTDADLAAAAAAVLPAEIGEPVWIDAPHTAADSAAARAKWWDLNAVQQSTRARHLSGVDVGGSMHQSTSSSQKVAAEAATAVKIAILLQHFLAGRALPALGYGPQHKVADDLQFSSATDAEGTPAGPRHSTAAKGTLQQLTAQQQPRHEVHSRPDSSMAADPAAGRSVADHQQQQDAAVHELLLVQPAPLDVQLSVTGACPGVDADTALNSREPEWYVTQAHALKHVIPAQQTTIKVSPAAAAQPAETGSGGKMAAAAGQGGAVYIWDVPTGTADLVLLASGAKPCTGFRVWVEQQGQQQQQASPSDGLAGAGSSRWRDVTGLAAPLPVLQDELVYDVRQYSLWMDVMHGKDYLKHAAWTLALTHQQHFTTRTNATRVALWLAPAAADQPGSSSAAHEAGADVLPAAASLTAQWVQHSSSSSSRPALHVGPMAWLRPLMRPAGGALLLELQLHWRWLIGSLSARVTAQPKRSSSDGSCWQPVAVYASSWGGLEHVTIFNTTAAAGSSTISKLAQLQQRWLQPWIKSGVKASSQPGTAASSSESLLLADVLAGSSVTLLIDPTCDYSISLGWDLIDVSAQVLLGNASAAAGMVVALLLLVLSHQMSSSARILAAVRQGAAAAAAAAGVLGPAVNGEVLPSVRNNSSSAGDRQAGAQQSLVAAVNDSSRNVAPVAACAAARVPVKRSAGGAAVSRLARTSSSMAWAPAAESGPDNSPEGPGELQAGPDADHPGPDSQAGLDKSNWQQQLFSGPGSQAGSGGPGNSLKGLSLIAVQKLRGQFLQTLGGAPPTLDQLTAAAAGAGGSSSMGISVLESLIAVTSDSRVLLAAAALAALAAVLDGSNPHSLRYWGDSNDAHGSLGSSSSRNLVQALISWLLQKGLFVIGLSQRLDSPGMYGTVLLLCVALLFLLVDVWLTVGVKWCLDRCTASVKAFNSSLSPDPANLAAIAAASSSTPQQWEQQQQQSAVSSCACVLCTAADAACGGPCAAAAASGGFFGGGLCGLDASLCCDDGQAPRDQTAAAAGGGGDLAASDDRSGGSSTSVPSHGPMTRDTASNPLSRIDVARTAAPAAVRLPLPWWKQQKCQVQIIGLLLLAAVHVDLALAAAVLLLFLTWHLPAASNVAAAAAAAPNIAGSPPKAVTGNSASVPAAATAVELSVRTEASLAAEDYHAAAAAGSQTLSLAAAAAAAGIIQDPAAASSAAAAAATGSGSPGGLYRSSTAGWGWNWGTLSTQSSNAAAAAAAAAAASSVQTVEGNLLSQQQQQQQRQVVRSGAGLDQAGSDQSHDHDDSHGHVQQVSMHHQHNRRSTELGSAHITTAGESLHHASSLTYHLGSSLGGLDESALDAGGQDMQGGTDSPLRVGRFGSLLVPVDDQQQQQQHSLQSGGGSPKGLVKHGSFTYHQQQLLLQQQQQQQQRLLPYGSGAWYQGGSPRWQGSLTAEQQRQFYYQQRMSIGGLPPQQQQQQQQLLAVSTYDPAAAKALALHQLTCHMAHAWTLLYGCCCLMLLPSLLAWLQLPLGQQHLSRWVDVLLLLPVLLHCVTIAAGTVEAMVGCLPAAVTAATVKQHKVTAIETTHHTSTQQRPRLHLWDKLFIRPVQRTNSPAAAAAHGVAAADKDADALPSIVHSQPIDLHKLFVRCAAVYMFTAALLGQAVMWSYVVPAVACLMLAGHRAVDAWQFMHAWGYAKLFGGPYVSKQKGT